jgi:hypothetical protein
LLDERLNGEGGVGRVDDDGRSDDGDQSVHEVALGICCPCTASGRSAMQALRDGFSWKGRDGDSEARSEFKGRVR